MIIRIPPFSWRNAGHNAIALLGVLALSWCSSFLFSKTHAWAHSPVWPTSGLCLALMLRFGLRILPGIASGVLLARIANPTWISHNPLIPGSEIAEILIGWYLLTKCGRFSQKLESTRDFRLLFTYSLVGTFLRGLFVGLLKYSSGDIFLETIPRTFLFIGMSHYLGIVVFSPFFLHVPLTIPAWKKIISARESVLPLLLLIIFILVAFSVSIPLSFYPLSFLPVPFLLWICMKGRIFMAASATAIIGLSSCLFTISGKGPIAMPTHDLLTYGELWFYLAAVTATSMLIAALCHGRALERIRTDLSIQSAQLALWEWNSETGFSTDHEKLGRLIEHDRQSVAATLPTQGPVRDPSTHCFPWKQSPPKSRSGEHLNLEITLADTTGPKTYAFMGQVQSTGEDGTLVAVLGVARDITSEREQIEARITQARREAELLNLRNSLNPHFLFNSLNMIKSLVNDDAEKAGQALVSLSLLLRRSLESTNSPLTPLREELGSMDSYLKLQKLRFEDRLTTDIISPPEHADFLLPPLILHQLVENAFKHGISRITGPCAVTIRTERQNEHLLIRVANSGRMEDHLRDGIGLVSIRAQLSSQYGTAASFTIRNAQEGSVHAEIRIPWERGDAS